MCGTEKNHGIYALNPRGRNPAILQQVLQRVTSKHDIASSKKMTKKTPSELAASDRDVGRWHENMSRSIRPNSDVRLRRLNLFCNRTGTTPAKLVGTGKKDAMKVKDILLDHVSWLESQGSDPNYIDDILKSVKAWLAFNCTVNFT